MFRPTNSSEYIKLTIQRKKQQLFGLFFLTNVLNEPSVIKTVNSLSTDWHNDSCNCSSEWTEVWKAGLQGAYHHICTPDIFIWRSSSPSTPVFHCVSSMSLRSSSRCSDIPGALARPRPHNPHIPHFWLNIFHRNMLSPLAQVLRYAKHVLLFWNVGSLMSINTSNAEERLLRNWLVWSCIWWGYCFRQWGKVQTVFLDEQSAHGKESDN